MKQTQHKTSLRAEGAAIQNSGNQPVDPNQHITEYLQYYSGLEAPGFAVLLNGAWGTGKTFFIKQNKDNLFPGKKSIYVSVYGAESIAQIEQNVFYAACPFLDNGVSKAINMIAKAALKNVKIEVDGLDFDIEKICKKFGVSAPDVIIFDDLERCKIPINNVLGYINNFVEHDGLHVVIIANESDIATEAEITTSDSEIVTSKYYKRIKEKLIGQTLEIQPVLDQAFDVFIETIKEDLTKKFLLDKKNLITGIYNSSEAKNLRILKQTMWDFNRLFMALEDRHRENDEAMTNLLSIFFAIAFEVKSGILNGNDLESFPPSNFKAPNSNTENPKINEITDKYAGIYFRAGVISKEALKDMLIRGFVNTNDLRKNLNDSHFFRPGEDEPCYTTIINLFERDENEINNAIIKLKKSLSNFEFKDQNQILKALEAILIICEIDRNIFDFNNDSEYCKNYIDEIFNSGKIIYSKELNRDAEPINCSQFSQELGLMDKYQNLKNYLFKKIKLAEEKNYPQIATDLLQEMAQNPSGFISQMNPFSENVKYFYDKPVLAHIKPDEFVSEFFKLNAHDRLLILFGLKNNFSIKKTNSWLHQEEIDWIKKIHDLLLQQAQGMSKISECSMKINLSYSLSKFLEKLEKTDSGATS